MAPKTVVGRTLFLTAALTLLSFTDATCPFARQTSNGIRANDAEPKGVDKSCPETRRPQCKEGLAPKFRPIDGSCHKGDGVVGMAGTPYSRVLRPDYGDGVHSLRQGVSGAPLPHPRDVVNRLFPDVYANSRVVNHFFMTWAQLVAHDVTQKDGAVPSPNGPCCTQTSPGQATDSCARIDIARDDPFYGRHNITCLGAERSGSDICQGRRFREQRNLATHYVDASFVYGSDAIRARRLRSLKGGLLAARNIRGEEHLPLVNDTLDAGDFRVILTAMLSATQTVLLREHNRVARGLAKLNPHWDDERLYQETRRIISAVVQLLTYRDWLPRLVGFKAMRRAHLFPVPFGYSRAYSPEVDPSTANDFAAAAFRSFHSLIQNENWLDRSGDKRNTVVDTPANITDNPGMVKGIIEGMLHQASQQQDQFEAFQIKNRMLSGGRPFGTDLISTDIIRGREHGLRSYNDYRELCGLGRARTWEDFGDFITWENIDKLRSLYAHPDDVDYYVGGMLEMRFDSSAKASITSPVFQCVVVDQFRRYKEGDPYFFDLIGPAQPFTPVQLHEIRKQTVSKILCDNIPGLKVVLRNAFLRPGVEGNADVKCSLLKGMDLSPWKETCRAMPWGSRHIRYFGEPQKSTPNWFFYFHPTKLRVASQHRPALPSRMQNFESGRYWGF